MTSRRGLSRIAAARVSFGAAFLISDERHRGAASEAERTACGHGTAGRIPSGTITLRTN